jgi:aryl-alcohol dehydrogenase-like predicted oxidoreductase
LKLGLGTVQFGLDYGISNHSGKPLLSEVANILQTAKNVGIDMLDTASLYGNSEEILGNSLNGMNFHIVTKTPQFKNIQLKQEQAIQLKQAFAESLKKLRVDSVYGLLIHHADDLINEGSEYLMETLEQIKASGKVQKIGVSVYNTEQVEKILERYQIDLIQLPLNVFDQRLVTSGILKDLKRRHVEIHVRSVFLQGLLLMKLHQLPTHFTAFKAEIESYHRALDDYGLSPLQGALSYVNSIKEVDYAIVGVTNAEELQEIVGSLHKTSRALPDWQKFSNNDERLINPVNWQ